MALQSFSVGQVLTAAQVNALQANDYNQTVSNKTASYTLVAADKGTRVTMSSTSATTITVNTSLFSAGDTLFIQNLNTGVSTITAGTATVTTSASLALAQWEGGTLYFTSASAAIFFKSDGAAPAAGGGMTLLSTTTLSGTSTTISSISQDYINLIIYGTDITYSGGGAGNSRYRVDPNAVSSSGSYVGIAEASARRFTAMEVFGFSNMPSNTNSVFMVAIENYTSSVHKSGFFSGASAAGYLDTTTNFGGVVTDTNAITSIRITTVDGTRTIAGTIKIYGVK